MAVPIGVATERISSAGFSVGKNFWRLITYSFTGFFFLIFIVHAIVIGVEQNSLWAGISDIGGRFLLATEQLSDESNKIMSYGGIYDGSKGIILGVWHSMAILFPLIESIFVIYFWINILYRIMPFLPISGEEGRNLINLILAVFLFTIIQMLILSVHAGIAGEMKDVTTAGKIMMKPITCYIDFVKVIPLFIKPMAIGADEIYNRVNNITTIPDVPLVKWGNQTIVEVPAPKVS